MTSPVFIPGWCLGRGPLAATVDAFSGTFLDLPGYGDSPFIADFDTAVAAGAARLAPGSTLIGWSLGAQMALAIAACAPEKVGRLILIAGTASFVQRDGWPHAMPPATLAEFTAGIATDAEAVFPRFVGSFNRGDAQAKAVTREILDLADPRPANSVLLAGLAWLRDLDLRTLARQVQTPTLLVQGAADPLMPMGAAESLAELIPNAQLAVLAECAHAPFLSAPDAFRSAIRSFLHAPA